MAARSAVRYRAAPMRTARHPVLVRAGAVTAVLLTLAAGLLVAPSVGLLLAPAAALLLLLAHGVFLGEDLIDRLRTRRAPTRRRARRTVQPPAAPVVVRRTGRLIAFALAVRPPPARVAVPH